MKGLLNPDNRYGDDKSSAACSIFGMMDPTGRRFSSEPVVRAITNMHDRSNGLGGGFAGYGIYPEYPNHYALHVMYMKPNAKQQVETYLRDEFAIEHAEPIPTRPTSGVVNPPDAWRYFALPKQLDSLSNDDAVVRRVMHVNTSMADAFIFSSGKNMGVFKGVGFPEAIAQFFRLEDYEGYLWTSHGRFPTNTPGWWGGAHPFNILDWTVVHNGELSSYGINRRHLEMFGYYCTLQTDTEVAAYAVDLLVRRHGHSIDTLAKVLAAPLWSEIDRMPPKERALHQTLRQVYGSLLLNGPFTIIIAHAGQMIGLTDRIRLRPLVAGAHGNVLYLSSEESAIRLVCPDVEHTWTPVGGEPIVGTMGVAPGPAKSAASAHAAAGRSRARGRG